MHDNCEKFVGDTYGHPIIVLKVDQQVPDWELAEHSHCKMQCLVPISGLISIETQTGVWLVTPKQGLMIPAHTPHKVNCFGKTSTYVAFLDVKDRASSYKYCQIFQVSDLLAALLARVSELKKADLSPQEKRLMFCLIDEIHDTPLQAMFLPISNDAKIEKISRYMIEHPAVQMRLKDWAVMVCMSERNLTRYFKVKTQLSIDQWRKRLHIVLALQYLAEGKSVKNVANELGYDSDSTFIVMFKKMMGMTPKHYIQQFLS